MQIQTLDEPIKVRADFEAGGTVRPLLIRRRERVHRVTEVHASWVDRTLRHPRFFFSLSVDSGDLYQVSLRGESMSWHLESVTLDG